MKTHNLFSIVLLAVLLPALASTGLAQPSGSLVGTWQSKEGVVTIVLTLNADGTGKLDDSAIKYTIKGNVLLVEESGVINKYTFALQGDVLTLLGGDLEKPMAFERQGASPAKGLGARIKQAAVASPASGGPAGIWETVGPNGTIRLALKPDGTGTFGGGPVRWEFNQGILSLTGPNGTTIMYNATLTATSLTVSGAGLTNPVSFRRVQSEESANPPKAQEASKGRGGLVGKWQGPQGIVQINEDGSMIIQGTNYRYTVQGNTLTLIASDGILPVPFELSGDRLTVTIGGQSQTLQRVPADSSGSSTNQAGVAAELAGKWCYFSNFNANTGGGSMTDECFTLYPNGTYQYHREGSISAYAPGIYGATASQTDDSGTWSLSGSTLTAVSRTQGTSTYTLVKRNHPKTNDPMLCLDGRCFVTYGPKPPWR